MSPSELRDLLKRHGLHLSRELGQSFLIDETQAQHLSRLAGAGAEDTVIEIGTGLGTLTRALAACSRRVVIRLQARSFGPICLPDRREGVGDER